MLCVPPVNEDHTPGYVVRIVPFEHQAVALRDKNRIINHYTFHTVTFAHVLLEAENVKLGTLSGDLMPDHEILSGGRFGCAVE